MKRRSWNDAVSVLLLLALTSIGALLLPGTRDARGASGARDYFTDTILVDQDGRSHRFYSDLIAGHVVIMNVIFTGCRSSCPIIMGRLVELQDLLGPDRGKVSILSISVDPLLDTPQMLHAYAESLQAKPGWYFLTGAKDAVDTVLRRIGNRSSTPEDHSDVIVVGNDATGAWIKLTAVASTDDIAQAVAEVTRKATN
ncbi:SCO family protein [Bradyrhizobium diazoefficiens]|nr:SCO family protein [Bradyrhizobium diazoefficiens]MBR0774230.1 SCO family protein [Bradyrhizobium diazoefficiens]MBR0848853.1 SCO family protein [Bradyrhizobium diazoefficiens]